MANTTIYLSFAVMSFGLILFIVNPLNLLVVAVGGALFYMGYNSWSPWKNEEQMMTSLGIFLIVFGISMFFINRLNFFLAIFGAILYVMGKYKWNPLKLLFG